MNQPIISDKELLQELKSRFERAENQASEQAHLISQLRKVNEKLLVSEQVKSNFLSNIRNEFNNPLASVLELSKNIASGSLNASQLKKFSDLLYEEAFKLDFQLRNIFMAAEIEAGESAFSVSAITVSSLLQNIAETLRHQAEKKQIILNLNLETNSEKLFFTDAEKLHLIVLNLLSNAIQFSHERQQIIINSHIENELLTVSVKDHGQGIDEEQTAQIFDRFRQAKEGSMKSHGGHGLGLTISKALAEIISGELSFVSEKEKGSTFTIVVKEAQGINNSAGVSSLSGNDFMFEGDSDITL